MIPREKMLCDYSFNIEEAIEEIKQKIKEAQEQNNGTETNR